MPHRPSGSRSAELTAPEHRRNHPGTVVPGPSSEGGEGSRGTSRPLLFVFPMPENLANARMHWAVKNLKRRDYFDACDARQNAGLLPPPPKQPFAKVVVVNECLYLAGQMDDDNAAARVKWIWDWLKTRGYIADDRKKNILRLEYPKQRVKRDGNYRVELTLQEIKV